MGNNQIYLLRREIIMTTQICEQTEKILFHHLQAFTEGNVDAIIDDYKDDSLLITPDGAVYGRDQIKEIYENFFSEVLTPGSSFTLLKQIIKDEVAYIIWEARSSNFHIPQGTDTLIIRNEKIIIQTFSGQILTKMHN